MIFLILINYLGKVEIHLQWAAFEEQRGYIDNAREILENCEQKHPHLMSVLLRRSVYIFFISTVCLQLIMCFEFRFHEKKFLFSELIWNDDVETFNLSTPCTNLVLLKQKTPIPEWN